MITAMRAAGHRLVRGWQRISALWRRIPADVRLFLAFMALLVPLRVLHTSQIKGMYVDGGYYAEIAKHVRDGEGLVTNVSLYHFGYETFPHPTSVYPLWPWLLGQISRVIPLEIAAHWVPLGFGLLAVTAAFLFGRRLWPESLFPQHLPGLHAGHVFALGLAVHRQFVVFTSLPYTEGISWALGFLFLWRVVGKGPDTSLRWGVESGLWLALLYFSRYQFIVAPLAATCAYAVRALVGTEGVSRKRILAHAATALGICWGLIFSWLAYIRTFVPGAGLSSLLRFDQNKANDLLHPVDVIVENHGILDLLLDRLRGVLIAWDPLSDGSYQLAYYTLHWALALALPLMFVSGVRTLRREGLMAVLARLRRPEMAHWWYILLFAFGGILSIHVIHKHHYGAWYFTKRQGLMALPAFLLPLVWLLRQEPLYALQLTKDALLPWRIRLATVAGVLVLGSTLVMGGHGVLLEAFETNGEMRKGDRYGVIAEWLQARAKREKLVVAMDATLVQRVAWRTENVGYHWIDGPTPYEDLRLMTDRLGARYVIFRYAALREKDWEILGKHREQLLRDYEEVATRPEGYLIFQKRRIPLRPGAPVPPISPRRPEPEPPLEDSDP